MTDTDARREAARAHNGQFGAQEHSAPEATLRTEPYAQPTATRALAAGDTVLTETNTDRSPFAFALNRSRDLRRRWSAAGMPQELVVTGRRRADEDGHTDDEVTFDLNGEPLVLTFHRDATFRTVHR
jgi:hypothetical protein